MNQFVSTSPKELPRTKQGLTSSLSGSLWHKFCYVLQANFFTLGFSLRTEGAQHVPRSGPLLVVANHQSFLDPVSIGLAIPRRLVYLARKGLFRNPLFRWLIRSLNAVPIDQDGVGKEGIRTILEQLALDQPVLIFPEGERSATGTMNPLKPGVHLLIKRAHAPIVPVGIAGAYDAWPRWRPYPILAPIFWPANAGTIAVSIGQPLDPALFANLPREQALQALAREIDAVQRRAELLRRR